MRVVLVAVSILGAGFGYAAELPLFFGSGSNFSGPVIRHRIQGDPRVEARLSQVDKTITLRMVTMANKAVVLVARPAKGDKTFVSTFQIDNDDTIFKEATAALDEKARQLDLALRARDPFYRSDVYEAREYPNRNLVVGLPLMTDDTPTGSRQHLATIILHPADEDTITGEFVVVGPNKRIIESLWFDVKREGEKRAPAPAPGPIAPKTPPPPKP